MPQTVLCLVGVAELPELWLTVLGLILLGYSKRRGWVEGTRQRGRSTSVAAVVDSGTVKQKIKFLKLKKYFISIFLRVPFGLDSLLSVKQILM